MTDSIPTQTVSRHIAVRLIVMTLASLLAGCGEEVVRYPVDSSQARSTLREVLQSWKDGKTMDSWRERDPEVIVQDFDWMSGAKLEDFELLGDGEAIDANLHCPVRLSLRDESQGSVEREVTYLVGTSPKLTVFRQVMP